MFKRYDYTDLRDMQYTGTAWNVYYEFGNEDEWWGHSGEYADELDAWFLTLEEAQEFAKMYFPEETLEDILHNAPESGGAKTIMLCIRSWEWRNGVDEFDGDEEYYSTVSR